MSDKFCGRGRVSGPLLRKEDQVQQPQPGLGRGRATVAAHPAVPMGASFLGRGRGRGWLLPEGAQAGPPLAFGPALAPAFGPALPPAAAPIQGPPQGQAQIPGAGLPADN